MPGNINLVISMSIIKVSYKVVSTKWHIEKMLSELSHKEILSLDTETRGLYSKKERKEATEYLKRENIPVNQKRIALQIEANSGLSFPSLIAVTHFVFGLSEDESVILICTNPSLEIYIWNWIAEYNGLLLIHNTLYDLKIMYHRIRKLPKNYEDTQLLAKCLTNHVNVWKCKVGLKDLMGSYYDPSWSLLDDYEPDNLKDPKFLQYGSIDGAAVIKLWNDIQEHMGKSDENETYD